MCVRFVTFDQDIYYGKTQKLACTLYYLCFVTLENFQNSSVLMNKHKILTNSQIIKIFSYFLNNYGKLIEISNNNRKVSIFKVA